LKPGKFPAAVLAALCAAALFGASTPLAKQFVSTTPAVLLAGLLYLGSGTGLTALRLLRDRHWQPPAMAKHEWPWLLGAIACGGIVGPTLLMLGLAHMSAASASLLLNLEGIFTALLAWLVFRENADRRVIAGMLLIMLGGVLLSWPDAQSNGLDGVLGPVLIVGACLFWAFDNNLTRQVSSTDALFIAGLKGLVAASVNIGLALAMGQFPASWTAVGAIMLIGFLGYGVSLSLFVLALRGLGAARTGAYFGSAPFVGAAIAVFLFHESTTPWFWGAGLLMTCGLWLHLTERHDHPHWHGNLQHSHAHFPDVEHRHEHD
jgi:drug/metabolite transporter (DMT)-like permease